VRIGSPVDVARAAIQANIDAVWLLERKEKNWGIHRANAEDAPVCFFVAQKPRGALRQRAQSRCIATRKALALPLALRSGREELKNSRRCRPQVVVIEDNPITCRPSAER
jgi:hypothetical protein